MSADTPISFDPLACLVGLLAIWLTVYGLRRNYSVILRLVEVSSGARPSAHEIKCELFFELELLIRNCGRPLHDLMVCLEFRFPRAGAWLSMPLRHFGAARDPGVEQRNGEFSQGMVGRFGLKSYQMDDSSKGLLSALQNASEQGAMICVYSQGYLAKRLRIGAGFDLFKFRWNQAAWRINRMFDSYVTPRGSKQRFLKPGKLIPVLPCLYWPVSCFVSGIKGSQKGQKGKSSSSDVGRAYSPTVPGS